MDDFAQEMACVVRRLFPDDNKENVPPELEQQYHHHHRPQKDRGKENMMHHATKSLNIHKRKRISILTTLRSSPLGEISNGATVKTKNANRKSDSNNAGTTNHFYRSKGGVVTIKAHNLRDGGRVPIVKQSPHKQNFTIRDDTKMRTDEDSPPIGSDGIQRMKSPYEDDCSTPALEYMECFDSVLSERYPDGTDFLLIRDAVIANDGDLRGVAPMAINLSQLSKEELTTIRVLIVPVQRQGTMDQMGKLILSDSFGHTSISYDRSFWFFVLKSFDTFKGYYANESRDLTKRFDLLFGFTYHLSKHPHWMTHHARGWGGEKMIASLATRWKQLLRYSPGQMGLDKEYSYQAVLYFLEEFKTTVEAVDTNGDPKLLFDYKSENVKALRDGYSRLIGCYS